MSKKTIGLNPLEEYLSSPKKSSAKQEESESTQSKNFLEEALEIDGQGQLAIKGTRVSEEDKDRPAKQRITLHISSDLVDRIKNAVYWEPGLTVAGFAEEAFKQAIVLLEGERGSPFPQRKQHRLKGGRPVS